MSGLKFHSPLAGYLLSFADQMAVQYHEPVACYRLLKALDKAAVDMELDKPELTEKLVESFYQSKLDKKLSRGYLGMISTMLRRLCLFMSLNGAKAYYLKDNRLPPKDTKAVYVPSREEVAELIQILDKQSAEAKLTMPRYTLTAVSMILRLTYIGGTRPGEACGLLICNVFKNDGRIFIPESKGRKSRFVYLPEPMLALLDRHSIKARQLHPDTVYVFPSYRDGNLHCSLSSVESRFKQAWICLHGEQVQYMPTPHALRHSYCVDTINRWGREGIDLNKMLPYLSSQMGHRTPDDTLYYYHEHNATSQAIRSHLERDNEIARRFLDGLSP